MAGSSNNDPSQPLSSVGTLPATAPCAFAHGAITPLKTLLKTPFKGRMEGKGGKGGELVRGMLNPKP
eukprot:3560237-Amphidinium_carterae.1